MLFLAAACLLAIPSADKEVPRGYALLVGISEYDHDEAGDLEWPVNDVEELAARLDRPGSPFFGRVRVLTCRRGKARKADLPTAVNIQAAFKERFKGCRKGDSALVTLCGHGILQSVDDPKKKRQAREHPFFLPLKFQPGLTDYETGGNPTQLNLARLLGEMDKSLPGVSRMVLMDACRERIEKAKKAKLAANPLEATAVHIPAEFGVMYSCSPGQRAWENGALRHGVFTHFLLKGLDGEAKNRDGDVRWNDLVAYTTNEMRKHAKGLTGGRDQTPHAVNNATALPLLVPAALLRKGPVAGAFVNSIGMKFVPIRAGEFVMGSPRDEAMRDEEEGQRTVEFKGPFFLGTTEVTQTQYLKVSGKNPSKFARVAGEDTSKFPVESVTWKEAAEFCEKLSSLADERKAGRTYRLPTAAEWEYACRASTKTPFHFGKSLTAKEANINGRHPYNGERHESLGRPCPVDAHAANAWGLYGMHGNVWEWTADRYFPKETKQIYAEMRGGGWNSMGNGCRAANRGRFPRDKSAADIGFRVMCVVSK